jgi:flagellar biosynthesis GTPase FlhF
VLAGVEKICNVLVIDGRMVVIKKWSLSNAAVSLLKKGKTPFQCEEEGCGKMYMSKKRLRKHYAEKHEQFDSKFDEENEILHCRLYEIAKSDEKYPVPFAEAWKWLGYSNKANGKRKLTQEFIENCDFKVLNQLDGKPSGHTSGVLIHSDESSGHTSEVLNQVVEDSAGHTSGIFSEAAENSSGHTSQGGQPPDVLMLTVNCFKQFALLCQTQKGKKIRQYYIMAENKVHQSRSQLDLPAPSATSRLSMENMELMFGGQTRGHMTITLAHAMYNSGQFSDIGAFAIHWGEMLLKMDHIACEKSILEKTTEVRIREMETTEKYSMKDRQYEDENKKKQAKYEDENKKKQAKYEDENKKRQAKYEEEGRQQNQRHKEELHELEKDRKKRMIEVEAEMKSRKRIKQPRISISDRLIVLKHYFNNGNVEHACSMCSTMVHWSNFWLVLDGYSASSSDQDNVDELLKHVRLVCGKHHKSEKSKFEIAERSLTNRRRNNWMNRNSDSTYGRCGICLNPNDLIYVFSEWEGCHVVARTNGGSDHFSKKVIGHRACNLAQGTMSLLEYQSFLGIPETDNPEPAIPKEHVIECCERLRKPSKNQTPSQTMKAYLEKVTASDLIQQRQQSLDESMCND